MSRNKMFVAVLTATICIVSSGPAFARMTGGGYHSGGGSFAVRQNTMNHTMNSSGYDHVLTQNQNRSQNQDQYQHQNRSQNQDQYRYQNQEQNRNQSQDQFQNQGRIGSAGPADSGQGNQAVNGGNGLRLQDRDRIDQPATAPSDSRQ